MEKIRNYLDYLSDKKSAVRYRLIKTSNAPLRGSVVIVNDYFNFPYSRVKVVGGCQYRCGRSFIENVSKKNLSFVLVVTCDVLNDFDISKYEIKFEYDYILVKDNVGQDLGALWCVHELMDYSLITDVTFLNSSQYAGIDFVEKFIHSAPSGSYFSGMTIGVGPRFSLLKWVHFQSYALKFSIDFFAQLMPFFELLPSSKYGLIMLEVFISRFARSRNMACYLFDGSAWIKSYKIGTFSVFSYDGRLALVDRIGCNESL